FMEDLARGAFTYAPPSLDQLSRAMEVDRRYEDLGLGLVAVLWSRWPRLSASVAWRRVMSVISRPFDSVTAVRSIWSSIRWLPTNPDRGEERRRFSPNRCIV